MPFDVTEMRARLNEFMKEINDAATSPEDVERYAKFNAALHEINEQTDYYYQPREDGTYPPLDADGLKKLQEHYNAALEQSRLLLSGTEGGAVAERMRLIARELQPLLRSDSAALDMADSQNLPLPELIGRAREQAVDLGDQQTAGESGQLNTREHIQVVRGGVTEDGYFTATRRVEPEKKYQALLDRLESKYPPQFRPFINHLRENSQALFKAGYDEPMYEGCQGDSPEQTREQMVKKWHKSFHRFAGTGEAVQDIVWEPQYLAFMDEFYSEMGGISAEYVVYKSGERLTCEDGANIDRRNVGMSRVAGLLGKKDLVAHARPMMLIKNGVAVSGTFMQTADGVDLTKTTADDPIRGFTEDNFDSPEVFDDIAAMQGLDFICGNLDRHPGNFFMRFNPPKSKDGKLSGITLIDNDMSFGDTGPKEKKGYSFVMPEKMGVIGEDFVTAMEALTKEQLRAALADCGISEQELDKAWERKEALQAKIKADLDYFKDKAPGYTEKGRLRVVPKAEWSKYSIKTLAKTHPESQFFAITDAPNAALHYENSRVQAAQRKQESRSGARRWACRRKPNVPRRKCQRAGS